ncbi:MULTISPECIES: hypothetical protein [unclassified Paenibacillus]|uniref:hypothetical protein n=1 Tax=unclassified Paenibacillus TaxID=185978 RepID=UPI00363FA33A
MKQVQQTFTGDIIWEPLYQIETPVVSFEIELFQSATLRRLKHLHHFGAGALISPITHSRFEQGKKKYPRHSLNHNTWCSQKLELRSQM